MILFDIAISDAVIVQMIDCCWHFKQAHIVYIYDIQIQNFFNMWQILNNMSKTISKIMTELNNVIFKIEIDNIKDNIIVKY